MIISSLRPEFGAYRRKNRSMLGQMAKSTPRRAENRSMLGQSL